MRRTCISSPFGRAVYRWLAESIVDEIPDLFLEIGSAYVTNVHDGWATVRVEFCNPVRVSPQNGYFTRGVVVNTVRGVCQVPGLGDTVYVAPLPYDGDKVITFHISLIRVTHGEGHEITLDHIRGDLTRLVVMLKEGFVFNSSRLPENSKQTAGV